MRCLPTWVVDTNRHTLSLPTARSMNQIRDPEENASPVCSVLAI